MIVVQDLTKRYGPVEAVRDISFEVGQDQVLGFLGPNGAGKTTIMKILTGFHFPSTGKVLVDGISLEEDPVEVKKRIGYLPENVPLYGEFTVSEYLSFIADARLIPREKKSPSLGAAMDTCGLAQVRSKRIETLSKGYKQRLGLAQAIIHDPPILILDEPSSGLDPNQIIEIRALIKELGKRKTVILSTHILQEVEAVCSRVLILNEGRIAAQGRPEEIAETIKGNDRWVLSLKGADLPGIEAKLKELEPELNIGGLEASEGGRVILNCSFRGGGEKKEDEGERLFDWAVVAGLKILEMNRKRLSLEDIFVKLTNEEEEEV
ncbi:MAG: ATP-binding cassette domain-containing protein [Treponema sp.]|jgi:ABC-2 type transport system ATP-binding protein|nr:ATP-binding cassette domain-containing protein [Treponema sp.]